MIVICHLLSLLITIVSILLSELYHFKHCMVGCVGHPCVGMNYGRLLFLDPRSFNKLPKRLR